MISRGPVYYVDLNPVKGRKQRGHRPVLVVSSDAINQQPLVVTVVVGADAGDVPRDYPANVRVPAAESGLPKDTVFLCFQLRSLDPGRFTGGPSGSLSARRMAAVDTAIKLALDLG